MFIESCENKMMIGGFYMKEKILNAIDKNSKLTAKELAIMLDSTEEEVASLINQMEEEYVICGYPTLINWDKVKCERITALIEVKVAPQRIRFLIRLLKESISLMKSSQYT